MISTFRVLLHLLWVFCLGLDQLGSDFMETLSRT